MIWAFLALLGVPSWLILGALVTVFLNRRAFKRRDGIFALAIREPGAGRWPRTVAYGRAVRGVLVVNRGAALVRTTIYEVDDAVERSFESLPKRPPDARTWLLTLADGSALEVAAAAGDAPRLAALRRT